ncbi:hypothetical protein GCM10028818_57490 [Spirosoma horti]
MAKIQSPQPQSRAANTAIANGTLQTNGTVEQNMPAKSAASIVQQQPEPGETSAENDRPLKRQPNRTGLPDNLKAGVENLSSMSMDHVKIYYNSDKPAQLQAHAYAQGSEIHVAPGEEQFLPHEAWHVVQQAQGRVKPTLQMKQMKGDVAVKNEMGLEAEADLMGVIAPSAVYLSECTSSSKRGQR